MCVSGDLCTHSDVLGKSEDDITAMALQGRGVWLGTRNGYLFFLDAAAVQEEREVCHLGLQHCGEGRVKNIVPLVNKKQVSAKLEVYMQIHGIVHACIYMLLVGARLTMAPS